MTSQDYNDRIWNGSIDRAVNASVLIVDDRLRGDNYIYLESVVALARAIMRRDKQAIKRYYEAMAGVSVADELLNLLDSDAPNNLAFAINAILKFKPITVKDAEELEREKRLENYLIAA